MLVPVLIATASLSMIHDDPGLVSGSLRQAGEDLRPFNMGIGQLVHQFGAGHADVGLLRMVMFILVSEM